MTTTLQKDRSAGPAAKPARTTAHVEAVTSPVINSSVSDDVDGAVRRLSAAVQTALMRAERNRLGSQGGRL